MLFFVLVFYAGVTADRGDELTYLDIVTLSILALISFVLTVKRFHDINLSGWYYLPLMIPFIGVVFWVILGLFPPVNEGNKYGLDPRKQKQL